MGFELVLSWPVWTAAGVAIFAAGLTQGALGFGFPTISTPILFLVTDAKTAIILNLCFLGGKVVQAATLGVAGEIRLSAALANIPLTLIGLAGMYAGTRLQKRFSADTYNRLLRKILFAIAIVLVWQGARYFVH
jgi:uncharacterized membrane protein YfcA